MLRLVTIDLTQADLPAFERYEAEVLALAPKYGGRLEFRVRALDGSREIHLLYFPSDEAFERFRSDPARIEAQKHWSDIGAISSVTIVEEVP